MPTTPGLLPLLGAYLFIINALTLAFFGIDKASARSGVWRVRERTLLILALLGGSIGAITGTFIFRHKTKKQPFSTVLIIIILLQMAGVFFVLTRAASSSVPLIPPPPLDAP